MKIFLDTADTEIIKSISTMRTSLLKALLSHAQGHLEKHKANVEIYLENSVGIGEHSDVMESIEKELDMVAKYHDQIEILQKYFK